MRSLWVRLRKREGPKSAGILVLRTKFVCAWIKMVQINFRSHFWGFGTSSRVRNITSIPSAAKLQRDVILLHIGLAKVNESISINQARTQPLFVRLYYSEAN
jgi:hypothetical protein